LSLHGRALQHQSGHPGRLVWNVWLTGYGDFGDVFWGRVEPKMLNIDGLVYGLLTIKYHGLVNG